MLRCGYCKCRLESTDKFCPQCGAQRNPIREAEVYWTTDVSLAKRDERGQLMVVSTDFEGCEGYDPITYYKLDPSKFAWPD